MAIQRDVLRATLVSALDAYDATWKVQESSKKSGKSRLGSADERQIEEITQIWQLIQRLIQQGESLNKRELKRASTLTYNFARKPGLRPEVRDLAEDLTDRIADIAGFPFQVEAISEIPCERLTGIDCCRIIVFLKDSYDSKGLFRDITEATLLQICGLYLASQIESLGENIICFSEEGTLALNWGNIPDLSPIAIAQFSRLGSKTGYVHFESYVEEVAALEKNQEPFDRSLDRELLILKQYATAEGFLCAANAHYEDLIKYAVRDDKEFPISEKDSPCVARAFSVFKNQEKLLLSVKRADGEVSVTNFQQMFHLFIKNSSLISKYTEEFRSSSICSSLYEKIYGIYERLSTNREYKRVFSSRPVQELGPRKPHHVTEWKEIELPQLTADAMVEKLNISELFAILEKKGIPGLCDAAYTLGCGNRALISPEEIGPDHADKPISVGEREDKDVEALTDEMKQLTIGDRGRDCARASKQSSQRKKKPTPKSRPSPSEGASPSTKKAVVMDQAPAITEDKKAVAAPAKRDKSPQAAPVSPANKETPKVQVPPHEVRQEVVFHNGRQVYAVRWSNRKTFFIGQRPILHPRVEFAEERADLSQEGVIYHTVPLFISRMMLANLDGLRSISHLGRNVENFACNGTLRFLGDTKIFHGVFQIALDGDILFHHFFKPLSQEELYQQVSMNGTFAFPAEEEPCDMRDVRGGEDPAHTMDLEVDHVVEDKSELHFMKGSDLEIRLNAYSVTVINHRAGIEYVAAFPCRIVH
jgi:hypothetical protein